MTEDPKIQNSEELGVISNYFKENTWCKISQIIVAIALILSFSNFIIESYKVESQQDSPLVETLSSLSSLIFDDVKDSNVVKKKATVKDLLNMKFIAVFLVIISFFLAILAYMNEEKMRYIQGTCLIGIFAIAVNYFWIALAVLIIIAAIYLICSFLSDL